MHPLLDFFYRSQKIVDQIKIRERFPPITDKVQPLSFGKIGHHWYFITRKIEFGIALYTLHFDKEKQIELSFFLYPKMFKYEHCTIPFLKKVVLQKALEALFESIIIDAVGWNMLTIEGKFREYDFKDKEVYKAFMRTLDKAGFLFDEGLVSAVKALSKVKTPLEQALLRLQIKEWKGVKVDKGMLPDGSYYFILFKKEKDRCMYDLISDGDHICAQTVLKEKKLLLSLPFVVSGSSVLFKHLLEKILFEQIHHFRGEIATLECCVTTDLAGLVQPGFHSFKAGVTDKGAKRLFEINFCRE